MCLCEDGFRVSRSEIFDHLDKLFTWKYAHDISPKVSISERRHAPPARRLAYQARDFVGHPRGRHALSIDPQLHMQTLFIGESVVGLIDRDPDHAGIRVLI
jgi:hypothetical protein